MTKQRFPQIDGRDCIDPGVLYEDNIRVQAQTEFWGKANSITIEIGKEPGVAWLLVTRATKNVIAGTSTNLGKNAWHTITWTDGQSTTSFCPMVLVKATCASLDGEGDGPYLLELRDVRQVLKDAGRVTEPYNMTDPMPVGTYSGLRRYELATTNGGTPWTWQAMFDDLWTMLPPAAGPAPTLPWIPPHTPLSWRFRGESAWDAIHMVLDTLQSAIVCDPFTGALSVVALGDTQSGLANALANLTDNTLIDWGPTQDLAKSVWPQTVSVLFRGRVRTPNSVEQLDIAWQELRAKDVASGLSGVEAGRKVKVRSDLFDERDNESLTLNDAELNTTAAAIAARVALRYSVSGQHRRTEHPGIIVTVSPGTQIHRVRWRDYGDEDGTRTELWGFTKWGDATSALTRRAKHSTRLALCTPIEDTWQKTATGWAFIQCRVVRYFVSSDEYDENSANETDLLLYHPTGYPDNKGADVRSLHLSTGLWPCKHGREDFLWGTWDDVSERWELLAPYEDHWRFQLIDDIPIGGSGSARLRLFDGSAWITSSLVFTVYDSNEHGPFAAGIFGMAKYFGDSRRFEIISGGGGGEVILAEAYLDEDLCANNPGGSGSGEVQLVTVRDAKYLPNCIPFSPDRVTNPNNHEGPRGSYLLLARKHCGYGSGSGEDEEWIIFDVELREYCAVIGLKDTASCLKSAGLKLRGEWCPAGEPTTACLVVSYIEDCGSGSGSGECDLGWDFEPLYACCGQGSGGSVS